MIIGRRGFITGLVSSFAAPAIVHATSLMPVRVMRPVIIPATIDDLNALHRGWPITLKPGDFLTIDWGSGAPITFNGITAGADGVLKSFGVPIDRNVLFSPPPEDHRWQLLELRNKPLTPEAVREELYRQANKVQFSSDRRTVVVLDDQGKVIGRAKL